MKRNLLEDLVEGILLIGIELVLFVMLSSYADSPRVWAWGDWCAHLLTHTWYVFAVAFIMEVILGIIPKKRR